MFHDLWFRIRSLFRLRAMNAELNDEMEFHLAQEIDKLIRSGLSPAEARRRARLAFGFRDLLEDDCREARGTRALEELARDVRFALRVLRQSPGFTAVAILSLALGIGANTAMFQLVDAVRLRSLPVRAPAELYSVIIGEGGAPGNHTSRYSDLSFEQLEQIERRQGAFSSLAAWSPRRFNLANGGEMRPAEGMLVTGSFFGTLGVSARRGRVIEPADDAKGCATPAAVISDAFWRREFGGALAAIGSKLSVDGHPFTIVGITPPSFFGVEVGRIYDIAIPICSEDALSGPDSQLRARRDNYWLSAIGRLRPGWTAARADAHLRAISPAVFEASFPAGQPADSDSARLYKSSRLRTRPIGLGLSHVRANYGSALWLLLGSAALVLLIACGNLANLLLARASARAHEIAVRLALGASRLRLVRQLLTESLLLALSGGALGLAAAIAATRSLVAFLVTTDDPVALDIGLDWRVLSFSLATALATCLLFGLAPAITAARAPSAVRTSTGGAGRSLFRRALVAVQVALSVVLVAGALLFGRSLFNLLTMDTGLRAENVLVTSIDTRRLGFNGDRQNELNREVLARLRSTPGVLSAAQSTIVPMSGWSAYRSFRLEDGRNIQSLVSAVSSDYFATLGTRLLAGRDFGAADGEKAQPAAIVNEAFVRRFLSGADPIGRTFRASSDDQQPCRIVGLVGNTKYERLQEEFAPIAFFPASQMSFASNYVRYVARSPLPPAELTKAVRQAIAAVSPAIDIEFLRLDTELKESVTRERLLAALGGGFGVLAAVLAAVGLFGMLSYSVERRRREIGIRMALGADRGAVVRLVAREAGVLVAIGAVAGIAVAIAAGRTASTLLYGLKPNDPPTLAAAVVALVAVGLVAAYAPARRAAHLDPIASLRSE